MGEKETFYKVRIYEKGVSDCNLSSNYMPWDSHNVPSWFKLGFNALCSGLPHPTGLQSLQTLSSPQGTVWPIKQIALLARAAW